MKLIERVPEGLRPILQNTVAALLAALTMWLVGQGVLAPVEQKLEEQKIELKQVREETQKMVKLQKASNIEWGIPALTE